MTAYISQEPKMYEAYNEGKDLYAMIAASALGVSYEECLEFFPDGCERIIDGKSVISGSGKEFEVKTDENNSITVKYYEILETIDGEKAAKDILLTDKILSSIGNLTIINKVQKDNTITFYFAQ